MVLLHDIHACYPVRCQSDPIAAGCASLNLVAGISVRPKVKYDAGVHKASNRTKQARDHELSQPLPSHMDMHKRGSRFVNRDEECS